MSMNQTMEQRMEQSPFRLYMHYLVPSLVGMLLMAINILIDGLFVSHGVGELGIAGVNIAVPIYSIILSLSLWIGMGGATLTSIAYGKKDRAGAHRAFSHAIWMSIASTTIIIVLCLLFERPLVYAFGATETIYPYAIDYLHVILLFGTVFVLENILSIFIRNDGNPTLAMVGLIVTSVVNIVLNYIFIFQFGWGVAGAAYATVIGAVVGVLVLLTHFLKKGTLRLARPSFDRALWQSILSIGFPSFVIESTAAVVMIAFNIAFRTYAGEVGIVAYGVVNYLHTVFLMLFIGIGGALQPIVSYLHGARAYRSLQTFVTYALRTGVGLGIFIAILGFTAQQPMIDLFGITDPDVAAFTKTGIPLFFVGYIFLGVTIVWIQLYQSLEKTKLAVWMTLSRSILLFLPLVFLLPALFGGTSIWLAFPLAEGLTIIWVAFLLRSPRLRHLTQPTDSPDA